MTSETHITHSAAETQRLGHQLARQWWSRYGHQPVVFALRGELGAGKTQLVKGLATGLGITELITSPSYTLVNEYQFTPHPNHSPLPFVHIDAWRLPDLSDLESIGWSRFLADHAVIALEWTPNRSDTVFPPQVAVQWVQFAYGDNENDRSLTWETPALESTP